VSIIFSKSKFVNIFSGTYLPTPKIPAFMRSPPYQTTSG
ncbi:hypothetical protein NT07LI_3037, partial [Listeria innocua FSL S4-378]